jgi:hypothetical protein
MRKKKNEKRMRKKREKEERKRIGMPLPRSYSTFFSPP